MVIKVGDTIPSTTFPYVPWTAELEDAAICGAPARLNTDDWRGKKVVVISMPAAFGPTCHMNHMPPFVEKCDQFKAKGVDVVAFVAANDPFVMSAWGRVSGIKDKALMLSDTYAEWAAELGLAVDRTAMGFGIRTGRWTMILDDLKVIYVEVDERPEVTVSGADEVLSQL